MILYGLQGMSAQYEEVKNLLQILIAKIQFIELKFNPQAIGMALCGLQGMSSENPQAVGKDRHDISGMRCDNGVIKELLTLLTGCILTFTETMKSSLNTVSVSAEDLRRLYQATALVLRGRPVLLDMELRGKLEVARDLLLDLLNERRVEVVSSNYKSTSSRVERRVADLVSQILSSQSQCTVSVNEFLFGFEADVVMRLENGKIVNLEVDGPTHDYPSRKRFCSLRDDLLREKNVRVVRLGTRDIKGLSQSDLRKKLKIILTEYIFGLKQIDVYAPLDKCLCPEKGRTLQSGLRNYSLVIALRCVRNHKGTGDIVSTRTNSSKSNGCVVFPICLEQHGHICLTSASSDSLQIGAEIGPHFQYPAVIASSSDSGQEIALTELSVLMSDGRKEYFWIHFWRLDRVWVLEHLSRMLQSVFRMTTCRDISGKSICQTQRTGRHKLVSVITQQPDEGRIDFVIPAEWRPVAHLADEVDEGLKFKGKINLKRGLVYTSTFCWLEEETKRIEGSLPFFANMPNVVTFRFF
eukprot:gene7242-14775_t